MRVVSMGEKVKSKSSPLIDENQGFINFNPVLLSDFHCFYPCFSMRCCNSYILICDVSVRYS